MATIRLHSFRAPLNAVVIGASGGIGGAFAALLGSCEDVGGLLLCARSDRVPDAVHLDLADEASIAAAAETAQSRLGEIDLVIVATGMLYEGEGLRPEKTLRALSASALGRSFAVNAIGPALVAKHFLPLLPRDRKAVFAALSARVGSITDNEVGGWYAYRAAKAALSQLVRTAAIELARKHPLAACVTLHPGTVDTALSRPFQGAVRPERLFTPATAARQLLGVVDSLDATGTGRLHAWDGSVIPF
jgi:NAD(P)-dependent dehydrogenase (short-subunit alcohol dehydrogenase family)